ncbi:DUF742 domain-containing protein [Actinomadura fulvescens]
MNDGDAGESSSQDAFASAVRPYVRPYVITRGRVEPTSGQWDLLTMVVATVPLQAVLDETRIYSTARDGIHRDHERAFGLESEHLAILTHCQTPQTVVDIADQFGRRNPPTIANTASTVTGSLDPQSVADVAGPPGLPVGVVRVLLGDLLEQGLIDVQQPRPDTDLLDVTMYQGVLAGLRAL